MGWDEEENLLPNTNSVFFFKEENHEGEKAEKIEMALQIKLLKEKV